MRLTKSLVQHNWSRFPPYLLHNQRHTEVTVLPPPLLVQLKHFWIWRLVQRCWDKPLWMSISAALWHLAGNYLLLSRYLIDHWSVLARYKGQDDTHPVSVTWSLASTSFPGATPKLCFLPLTWTEMSACHQDPLSLHSSLPELSTWPTWCEDYQLF